MRPAPCEDQDDEEGEEGDAFVMKICEIAGIDGQSRALFDLTRALKSSRRSET